MVDPAESRAPSLIAPGTRIGHYQVIAQLDRGGMGVVYRARDLTLERDVALKSPWPLPAQSEELRHRFLREARAASRLTHPNVVPVFEAFEQDGVPWMVMPLIDGQDLRSLVEERGRLPPEEVLRLGEGLTSALQAAHKQQVLHRDLTPRNVLVNREGTALLTDFGLARILASEVGTSVSTGSTPLTEPGAVVGTPGYMSPEQELGRPLDGRSDLFSLGAVLYYMCTGAAAFRGTGHGEVRDAVLHHEPEPISRFTYDVPVELERIVRKALAKRPDERYQTPAEMLADLRALRRQVESGSSLHQATTASRARPGWLGRRGRVLATLATLVVVAAGMAWVNQRASRLSPKTGGSRQVTAASGWEARPVLSPDGNTIAYVSNESGNSDIWTIDVRGGRPLRLTDDPADDRDPAWFPDGSAVAFVSDRGGPRGIFKVARLGGSATALVSDAEDPAISPDGKRIAFSREVNWYDRIHVAPLEDLSRARQRSEEGDGLWDHRQPAWSPDGRQLCYADFRSLWLLDPDQGAPRRLTEELARDKEPVWSSDGRSIYFTSFREGTEAIWEVSAKGGLPRRVTMGTGPESQPSISRDGSRLTYSTFLDQSDIVLLDLQTRERSRIGELRVEQLPAVAPDRTALAYVSNRLGENYDLWLQPLQASHPAGAPRRLTDHPGTVSLPSFSPDGRFIAYHRAFRGKRDIWIVPTAGTQSLPFTDDAAINIQPSWSADGSRLLWIAQRDGRSQICIAEVRDGRRASAPRVLIPGDGNDRLPACSPDGTRVAFIRRVGDTGEILIAALDGATPPRQLTRAADPRRLAWEKNGALLVSGLWGGDRVQLRHVSPETGEVSALGAEVSFSDPDEGGQFGISPDGRLLAYADQERRGDVWVLEGESGSY